MKKVSGDAEASKPKEVRADVSKKTSADKAPVDKELLQVTSLGLLDMSSRLKLDMIFADGDCSCYQAFRFFDRNRVGYLRVSMYNCLPVFFYLCMFNLIPDLEMRCYFRWKI